MLSKTRKQNGKTKDSYQLVDIGAIFLRTVKLVLDYVYILIVFFGLMGMGMGFGYLASQIEGVEVPERDVLISQASSLTRISDMRYSDDSVISTISTDLLRTPVPSEGISENVKQAIIATEDENFFEHNGVVPKAVFRATLSNLIGVGATSGG